jgi:hypothetical protein
MMSCNGLGIGCCCKFFTDGFNRAGPGYGGDWHKESGTDPTIASSTYLDFSAPAELRCTTAHPDGAAGKAQLTAKFKLHAADDTIRFKLAWLDANNYVYIEIVYQDSAPPAPFTAGCSYFHIGYVQGGVDFPQDPIPLVDLSADTWHDVALCWFPDYTVGAGAFIGKVTCAGSQPVGDASESGSPEYGSYAAVQVVSGTAKVDDFYYGKAKGVGSATCPDCGTGICPIDGDDFNRANGGLGCKWHTRDGSLAIVSQQVNVTANNSRAQFLIPHPGLSGGGLIARMQVQDTAGAVARLWVGCAYLQYSVFAHGHSLAIYDGDCGGPTGWLIGTPVTDSVDPTGNMVELQLCIGGGLIHSGYGYGGEGRLAKASAPGICTEEVVTGFEGTSFIGGDNGTILDNFSLAKYKDADAFPSDEACEGCTCQPPAPGCADCLVDLGGGGWTYRGCGNPGGSCNACEDASGEFLVRAVQVCQWTYGDSNNCDAGSCEDPFGTNGPDFSIILDLGRDPMTGLCRWSAQVAMSKSNGANFIYCNSSGPPVAAVPNKAIYFSDWIADNGACRNFPVTLTKDSEVGDCPCNGSLPSTILLDAAV